MNNKQTIYISVGIAAGIVLFIGFAIYFAVKTNDRSSVGDAKTAANARSVEGHIKNIEYAIVQNAFDTGTGDLTIFDGKTSDTKLRISISLPDKDNIYCESLTIENGSVVKASRCRDYTWANYFSYNENNGAYLEEK